ncbi:MAG TPA: Bax inhibitor-1/YccA family protein, partial [Parachlamydiaceae bacterium]|nr:Bax inhibitor-1/YccA family protein [Parachlamydiaceae bacterium]
TGGIMIVYLVSFVLSLFGIQPSFLYSSSLLSIGISLFVIVIAALNFIIDFDFIEQGAKQNVPKYMEWYGAFAMMVTLIWLYIEFLRLLSKFRNR